MSDTASTVDNAVATFTKTLLGEARKQNVDFAAVGPKGSKSDEILAVLRENYKVAKKMLAK